MIQSPGANPRAARNNFLGIGIGVGFCEGPGVGFWVEGIGLG